MKAHWQYLKYVLRHKYFVFKAGRKFGVPIYLLAIHDWTKFLPSEWFPYVIAFYNQDGSKKEGGFRTAGLYPKYALNEHVHRNKHHWSRWLLPDGESLPMPDRYRREMLADWYGAGLANGQPDTRGWYLKNKDAMTIHADTRQWIEKQLGVLSND